LSVWSPDGRYLLLYDSSTGFDIHVLPLTGERKRKTLVGSKFNETHPRLSSDGRWLAYISDESGTREVYVQPFDPDRPVSGPRQVSTSGGGEPRWRGDAGELYYLSLDGKMIRRRSDGKLMPRPFFGWFGEPPGKDGKGGDERRACSPAGGKPIAPYFRGCQRYELDRAKASPHWRTSGNRRRGSSVE